MASDGEPVSRASLGVTDTAPGATNPPSTACHAARLTCDRVVMPPLLTQAVLVIEWSVLYLRGWSTTAHSGFSLSAKIGTVRRLRAHEMRAVKALRMTCLQF